MWYFVSRLLNIGCLVYRLGVAEAFAPSRTKSISVVDTRVFPKDSVLIDRTTVLQRRQDMSLRLFEGIEGPIRELASSLFRYEGTVPILQAAGLNAFLFAVLQPKVIKMLTPAGFAHAFALGTMLWNTLGWRGWSLCVAYFFLGQAVTKVRFADKEKRGIAEKRGGRRGPENVW
jgi:hypothetical protein